MCEKDKEISHEIGFCTRTITKKCRFSENYFMRTHNVKTYASIFCLEIIAILSLKCILKTGSIWFATHAPILGETDERINPSSPLIGGRRPSQSLALAGCLLHSVALVLVLIFSPPQAQAPDLPMRRQPGKPSHRLVTFTD
jgi:hypothetical protein